VGKILESIPEPVLEAAERVGEAVEDFLPSEVISNSEE
jgi:hypothetical protein